MLIHEFHSRLVARNEKNALFEAMRRLRLLDSPQRMVASADSDDGDALDGWTIWSEPTGGNLAHGAKAGV